MKYPDIGIHIMYARSFRKLTWNWQNLAAPFWRFYWNETIGGYVDFREEHMPLLPGNAYLIPPGTHYNGVTQRPFHHFFVHFTAKAPYDKVRPDIYTCPLNAALRTSMHEAISICNLREKSTRFSLLCGHFITGCLLSIPEDACTEQYPDERVSAAIEFMNREYSRHISLGDIADAAGVGLPTLHRLFKTFVGSSPHHYLIRLRIANAASMLRFSSASMDEIAESSGFADRFHFTRFFSREKGITPAKFRSIEVETDRYLGTRVHRKEQKK